jgi:transcriptional regulator with XRE-family HTH domain
MRASKLVAWNLRRLRVAKELSQESLAVDAGVDRSFVGRIERGLENPTVETLEKFSNVLGIAPYELLLPVKANERPPATLIRGRKKR